MNNRLRCFGSIGLALLVVTFAAAQPRLEVLARGLVNPIGIAIDGRGNLWVGEQGTGSGSTGSVSMVTPDGQVHQFLKGIPSTAPGYEPISAEHVAFDVNGKLLVLTGTGASPYSESVIVVDTAGFGPGSPARDVTTRDTVYNIGGFVRADGAIPNPYRIVVASWGDYYIVDASYNALLRRERSTGNLRLVKKFPHIGTVEAVPTGLAYDGARFYVGTLTGIPIPPGLAVVYTIDTAGTVATFSQGFTSIVDVALNPRDGSLFVLQHARFSGGWVNGTGALLRVRYGHVDTLITGMNRPSGMVFGPDGTLYITSVADDNILKVTGLNAELRYSSTRLDFGPLLLAVSDTLSCRIENLDTAAHALVGFKAPGSGFSLADTPALPRSIPGRGAFSLRMVFRPNSAGSFKDSLVVSSDDAERPTTVIQLSGSGNIISAVAQPGVMYAVQAGAPLGRLNTMDTKNGTAAETSSFGLPSVDGLAIRRATGELLGAVTSGGSTAFYRISPVTGDAALIRRLPLANMSAIVFGNGDTLYGGTRTGSLYIINPFTGSFKEVGSPSGIPYYAFSISPKTEQLWASARAEKDTSDTLYTIGRTDGIVSRVGAMGTGMRASIAFDSAGALFGLTGGADGLNTFISINTQTGAGAWVGSETFNGFAALASRLDGTLTDVAGAGYLPDTYSLSQNYPNPFNPSTEIRFDIPLTAGQGSGRSNVRLVVYDLLGREVATLVQGSQEAGAHSIRWDASQVASGVYLYTLQADAFFQSRKMILLR